MTAETLRAALGWATLINWGMLFIWWFFISVGRDLTYRVHSKFFTIPEDRFDEIHYKGIMYFKVLIFVFNLAPYLALRIVL